MRVFRDYESKVRGYIRSFPTIFKKAKGSLLYDEQDKEYIDFFAGAGALNYGHNNDIINDALVDYIKSDGIMHGLDLATTAKKDFILKFVDTILQPRNMDYKIQFTGPTGTNAVETALKLVRIVKRRSNVVAFTNGFHGLTMGSLAITGNAFYRDEAYISRCNVFFMPYDKYFGDDVDTINYFRKYLEDPSSGLDLPAAVIVETVQAEGGVNVASFEWLKELEDLCREFDILLIVDDIQVGNGRTGKFFSFEDANIYPDVITVSKSIGCGLPLAFILFKPELDQWRPGEHTGTFRGNNLAFVASTKALDYYWTTDDLSLAVENKSKMLHERLVEIVDKYPQLELAVRGRGMIYGLECKDKNFASLVSKKAFEKGLIIELAGPNDEVLKFLPPLVIENDLLMKGLDIIDESIDEILEGKNDS
ncbi:MAG: diaminobutyrate--2-oxoglutarate transaminase [Candidatus Methanoliparum thermophilum]|uniref:Diaminobutyrate--2-oxoglutarate transaminase n=1 Tax=Methanoliparum thermophilum TaxID=2491083 RepID=A0A520KT97_METT2|nr:diaminobutyrate--2-oxoglutarate transaminase [Candidatus Methanoliparum sp. LAM-1]RZN65202.1 MAG: diaminobutyrate--2-oxoglutarate transaminase [Candidatus Methanoliparum thermophilum]BDC36614.1 diaminobutyrate--2-oxoglutarate transaminase [Candidatus Methanoliparum sp. LAM-1]